MKLGMIFFCFIFCLQKHEVSLSHIESRPSVRDEGDYEFLVEFCAGEYGDVKGTLEEIKKQSTYCKIISREEGQVASQLLDRNSFSWPKGTKVLVVGGTYSKTDGGATEILDL